MGALGQKIHEFDLFCSNWSVSSKVIKYFMKLETQTSGRTDRFTQKQITIFYTGMSFSGENLIWRDQPSLYQILLIS